MLKAINKNSFIFTLLVFLSISGISQQYVKSYKSIISGNEPDKKCDLPNKVNETSGIILFDNTIWTINDSGGKHEIYGIDVNSGEITRTVNIFNAKNSDWEDIAMDEEFIYVGDFGNNWGMRKNQVIYKVSQKEIKSGKSNVAAELIYFSFADQTSFEKMNRKHNFDCESMISYGDSLILFSKNWADNKTRMYKVSKNAGKYSLKPLDTFNAYGLVTGADYNAETNKLVLIGYENFKPFVFLLENYNGNNFESNQVYRINFPQNFKSQTEGICWTSNNSLMISREETQNRKQALFEIKPDEIINPGLDN